VDARAAAPSTPRSAVVLVISDLEYGGSQRQVIELANHLDPSRFAVFVCSLADYTPLASSLVGREERLVVIPRRHKWDVGVVLRLAAFLRKRDAAVVHSFLFDADIAARIAGRLAGRTAVVGSERNAGTELGTRHRLAYALTRWGVDLVVANSHAGARFNSRVFRHPPSLYRVVHNAVDGARFAPHDGRRARRLLGLPDGAPVVGMFASFKPQKNHGLFLRSAVEVLRAVPEARFLFVGDELYKGMSGSVAFKKSISALVDELGLRDRCLLAGNRADVERLYCACDCTVLPSLFEGTPNVAVESMACGVPVVVTDVSDNAYVVRDGETGFVVPLGEPGTMASRIVALLESRETRAAMGARARLWVLDQFSPMALADRMAAAYDEAVARRRRGRSSRAGRSDA
jgi:glycosyltransferase involved in cell wall biosynthesis